MKHDDTIEEKVPPEGAEMGEQASEEQDQEKLYPVRLKDLEEPIQEDCSSDAIPYRTTDMEGKKKVLVPELISMTKVLFDNYRLPLYSYLNRCLRNGNLAGLVGSRILNDRIRSDVCNFPHVTYWRIDRENFYADVEVELKLKTPVGTQIWKGYLVCWCAFEGKFICSIEELTDNVDRKGDGYDQLSKYLVPYSTNKRMDQIAEDLWRRYLPEALTDPGRRVAEELAKRMGLTIEYHPIYEHRRMVDSVVFFKEDRLNIGEDRVEKSSDGKERRIKADTSEEVMIPANTIVVNTNRISRDYSAFNIFHECIHFEEHYLFFRLQELDSNDLRQVKTREIVIDKDEVIKDAIYFMEKQANRGAYGLMMPETHTRELIRTECRNAENYRHVGEKFELAGIAIGKTLHLPHFRIRARMVQLGNIEAKGALNYIRKDKIEPFAFDRDSWREEQHTFVIDELTVNALRRTNPDFEQVMKSGRFVYADGHVILNDPKYVKRGKDDKFALTDEALKHVDDCCLRFVRLYVQQNVGRYVYGRLYYDSDLQKRTEFYLSDYINQKQMSLPDAKYHYKRDFPETFKEAFEDLMRKNGETQETMADKLGTTSKSLRDWLNDPEHKITLDFVVIVALMWKLPDWITRLLIESAGKQINERNPRHRDLDYIIDIMWDQGIEEANKYLTSHGHEILRVR